LLSPKNVHANQRGPLTMRALEQFSARRAERGAKPAGRSRLVILQPSSLRRESGRSGDRKIGRSGDRESELLRPSALTPWRPHGFCPSSPSRLTPHACRLWSFALPLSSRLSPLLTNGAYAHLSWPGFGAILPGKKWSAPGFSAGILTLCEI